MKAQKITSYLLRTTKILFWIFAGLLSLIVLTVAILQLPPVQSYIARQVVSSLSSKTHSRIEVGSVNIAFAHSIVLRDIFIESQHKDTLVFIQTLAADVNLLGLLSHDIALTHVRIDSLTAHMTRTLPDSSFNFDFVIAALSPAPSAHALSDSSTTREWTIGLGGLSLRGIHCTYVDDVDGMNLSAQLGSLDASFNQFDLAKQLVHVATMSLDNCHLVVETAQSTATPTVHPDVPAPPWTILLDHLLISQSGAQYDVRGAQRAAGVDPNHISCDTLNLRADNICYGAGSFKAHMTHAAFSEHSGLVLRDASGGFVCDSIHAEVTDGAVTTAGSMVHLSALLRYTSLAAIQNDPGDIDVKVAIDDSHVSIAELLLVQPSFPIRNSSGAAIRFSSRFSGPVRDLRVEECRLFTGDSTALELNGTIRGVLNPSTAYYDVHLLRFATGRKDIQELIPDNLLPRTLHLPERLHLTGHFTGTIHDFYASSELSTSMGRANASVMMQSGPTPGSQSSRWKAGLTLEECDVGSLIHRPATIGPISLTASATGTGLRTDDFDAHLEVFVDKATLNGYPYRHLSIQGSAGPHTFAGKAEMADSNLAFTFDGAVNSGGENPAYRFVLNVTGADLQRLHFTDDDIRVAGVMTADLTGKDINDVNGTIGVRNVVIVKNRKHYQIDSLIFASVNKDGVRHMSVQSPLLTAAFDGTITPGDLPAVLTHHINRYFSSQDTSQAKGAAVQNFAFHLVLTDPGTLTEVFFPQLERLNAAIVEGSYDSKNMNLVLDANVASVTYSGMDIDSVSLTVRSDVQRLVSTLQVKSIADSMIHLTHLQLRAVVAHDSIALSAQSLNDNGDTKLLLAGVCTHISGRYRFRFQPDGIIFQNDHWHIPADNAITFDSTYFSAHDVVLSDGSQRLSFVSTDSAALRPPLTMTFTDFHLSTLSRVVERDSGLIHGVLNGSIVLRPTGEHMAFSSDLGIHDLMVLHRPVGDVMLHVTKQAADVYDVNMNVSGNDNDIAVRGHYRSMEGGSALDLDLSLRRLNLAAMEPFVSDVVERLSGNVSGEMHLTGTLRTLSPVGQLEFTNTGFRPRFLGTYLRISDGRISVDGTGVHFGSFEILDTLGHSASLSGNILTNDFREFEYACRLRTDKFLLINTPATRDAMYYGTVILDSDIFITGNRSKPVMRAQARLDKGTDLAIALPEEETDVQRRGGIVRFVDVKHPQNSILSRRKADSDSTRDTTGVRPSAIDLTANVEVDKEARLRILIDPVAGDSLVIRGEATFSVGMDPGGKLSVTGRYEIVEGSYQLSFGELIRREFAIEKGSSLTWTGSVMDATVAITAVYTAKTSALDLVQDQLSALSQEERNKYKQELRIQVYLVIDGNLLAPNIHFRLDLPPEQRGVLGGAIYAKLIELNGQESDLNKQVFALLVMGRFIPTNPLASASDGGALTDIARSSVSQVLTQQLNRLAGATNTGVNLNVGVESYDDYSTGAPEGRTQLQLALSKQLFDERLTLQVGGNVDLEGERSQHNSLNSFAGDIKVAYKLTEDGRWQLQAFRNSTYTGALEGDIVETGVGIMFTIDYNKLFGFTLTPVREEAKGK